MDRPPPPYDPPAGFRWKIAETENWRTVTGKRCRRWVGAPKRICGQPSVMEINRGAYTNRGRVDRWWAYCEAHLYGHWIEDGKIMDWRLEKADG